LCWSIVVVVSTAKFGLPAGSWAESEAMAIRSSGRQVAETCVISGSVGNYIINR
jgi:hypothetical protein